MTTPPLLDTHAAVWWATGDSRLSAVARAHTAAAGGAFVSAATAWELRTKYRLGKLPELRGELVADLEGVFASHNFRALAITFADGDRAGALPGDPRDPFDRMLAAQALNHGLALVSNDASLDAFGIVRIW